MANINKLVIDCNNSRTDLCNIAVKHNIDKCVYSNNPPPVGHLHPYTMIYDMLFGGMRYLPITIGEIGILKNGSMKAWRDYFVNATLYGWDFDLNLINNALIENIDRSNYHYMNVHDVNSIDRGLSRFNGKYDFIIDDSDHHAEWAYNIMSVVHKYLRTGGVFVIEDVQDPEPYDRLIGNHAAKKYFNSMTLVDCQHNLKKSWDNDKFIVMYRNDVPSDV